MAQITAQRALEQYPEAVNHPDTWEFIARELRQYRSMVIRWSDERFTEYTILFSWPRSPFTMKSELFVTISGYGTCMFGVQPNVSITSATVERSFGVGEHTHAAVQLARLLQEVLNRIAREEV